MENLYSTTDMELAVILSMNFPIKELQNNRGRGTFIFENSDELQDFVKAFWDKQLTVEPQALFQATKIIKNRLYSEVIK